MKKFTWALVWLTVGLVFGCVPGGGGGGGGGSEEPGRGIIVVSRSSGPSGKSCFTASISYQIEPSSAPSSIQVRYEWNQRLYSVDGLANRSATPDSAGDFLVDEQFEVCPTRTFSTVQTFDFRIIAKTRTRTYRSFPSVTFIKGSDAWDESLAPTIAALKRQLESGDRTPSALRSYWKALASYFHGGQNKFKQHIGDRASTLVREAEVKISGRKLRAYRTLLSENGENVDVSFDLSTGLVSSITLNESYQLERDYKSGLMALLTSGAVGDLVGLTSEDELRLLFAEPTPAGISLTYQRFRERLRVIPDRVSVFLHATSSGYRVDLIDVGLGDVGGESCAGADWSLAALHDLTSKPGMTDVEFRQALYRTDGVHYRCVFMWWGRYTPPREDTDLPYVRIIDALNGKAYADYEIIMSDGADSVPHRVKVRQTIPYQSPTNATGTAPDEIYAQYHPNDNYPQLTNVFNRPTSMFGGELYLLIDTGEEYADLCPLSNYTDCRLDRSANPLSPLFTPNEFGLIAGPTHSHADADVGYLVVFNNQLGSSEFDFRAEQYDPWSSVMNEYQFGELARESSEERTILFEPAWTSGHHTDGEGTDCTDQPCGQGLVCNSSNICECPRESGCGDFWSRAQGFTASAYLYAQYARYIWMGETNGLPVWSDGPTPSWGGRHVAIHNRGSSAVYDFCGQWNGYQTITFRHEERDGDGGLRCDMRATYNGVPHELGHWVGNVVPIDFWWRSAAAARNEGFADYMAGSLRANWVMPSRLRSYSHVSSIDWQFKSKSTTPRYRGNVLYPWLRNDHSYANDTKHQYQNSFNWSGMWSQYMNLVGNYYSDPTVTQGYRGSSDYVGPDGKCHDTHCSLDWCRRGAARETYKQMYGWESSRDTVDHWETDKALFVNNRSREIQQAAIKHNWMWKVDISSARRQYHNASLSPSHAYAITLNDHRDSRVNVRFESGYDVKWVNFFAHANLSYMLRAVAPVGGVLRLYHVRPSTTPTNEPTSTLEGLAFNTDCQSQTQSPFIQDSEVDIQPLNACESFGPPPTGELMITFTPEVSGWYYASVYAPGKATGKIELKTSLDNRLITTTTRNATSKFDDNVELRLGQSIPVSVPGTILAKRSGFFRKVGERHFWRFQYIPTLRFRDAAGGWSDKEPLRKLFPGTNASYRISIQHDTYIQGGELSKVDLNLYIADPTNPDAPPSLVDPTRLNPSTPQAIPGLGTVQTWSIDALDLVGQAPGGVLSPGQNIYIDLKWVGPGPIGTTSVNHEYDIFIETVNQLPSLGALEDDSSAFNPIIIDRWCANEQFPEHPLKQIERTTESFSLNERLAPDDADYVVIWLEEGEHLNVTYRGEIPGALDVGGPVRTFVGGDLRAYESELSYIWPAWPEMTTNEKNGALTYLTHADTDRSDFINEWRPFYNTGSPELCVDGFASTSVGGLGGCNHQGEYYAERGYLWSYNSGLSNIQSLDVTDDNAFHLTATAFVTGRYVVRVRGQHALFGNSLTWPSYESQGIGVPYTLNLNIGVAPNPRRPHWQFLDPNPEPVSVPYCGRP
ncbi:MAG: hypothetical protein ABI333_30250 [bacterium]